MADLLLIGAGFSRNWGGWLAKEAFEYLLGTPEVARDAELRQLLWRRQKPGGFEAALAELQARLAREPHTSRDQFIALQSAVKRMFDDMNKAFMAAVDWQFGQKDADYQIGTFLARFDAIFTLNQDLLLEHHYVNRDMAMTGKKTWAANDLPGMRRIAPDEAMYDKSWSHSTWTPLPEDSFKVNACFQPIFKLHGSSNWFREDGQSLIIMGGAKVHEIGLSPLLNWYAHEFERRLAEPSSRLMVIGYGFGDDHINSAIARAVEKGLKLFIVAPEGSELVHRLNETRSRNQIIASKPMEETIEKSLIGASRRDLHEIFGHGGAEFSKVMRFFDS